VLRLLDETHPDPAGALGTDHPQPRMPLRILEHYQLIPNRDYREGLYGPPPPYGPLLLPFSCSIASSLTLFHMGLGLTRLNGPIRVKRSGSVKGVNDGQER
jgi:hypothetical protein